MRIGRFATAGVLAIQLACPAAWAQPRQLTLGFVDPILEQPDMQAEWLPKARAAGAEAVRVSADWWRIAPSRPASPSDPADPAYNWATLDAAVRGTIAAGLHPTLLAAGAPAWAEGGNRPANVRRGAWNPDAEAFGAFASALARRYRGDFADASGIALPRVGSFQAWNEPNLNIYLAPQWSRRNGRWIPSSPALYRNLLNHFYAGIKSVSPNALVVGAGTAPFGDPFSGGDRMPPAFFWRGVFCLSPNLRAGKCGTPAHLDVIDHHPYSVGAPSRAALNADDVSIPDLAKITVPLKRAVSLGTVVPKGPKPLWVTEISWDSSPPDPDGVPEATRARWLQDCLFSLWRQGASLVTWYLLRDQAPDPSFAATYQSGMYSTDGRPKLGLRAFRFPLASIRNRKVTTVWTRSPAAGVMQIQQLVRGRWLTLKKASVAAEGLVVVLHVGLPKHARIRARINAQVSLPDVT